jgi:hypothetical protein
MEVCFLMAELGLAGGVGVVIEHARRLANEHGMGVTLCLQDGGVPDWARARLAGVTIASLSDTSKLTFDVAVATYWRTTYDLFELRAERYAYFVQSLEDRFYRPGDVERLGVTVTYDLPLAFITEARWIAKLLADLRPEAAVRVVPNGIDKRRFAIPERPPAHSSGPLRILVEGHPDVWYKGVADALSAVERMTESAEVTLVTPELPGQGLSKPPDRVLVARSPQEMPSLYSDADVVLKLSRVEGLPLPPIEGFHMGATCVVTPVTGVEEYIEHGVNGLIVDFDDLIGTARWLDLLARDPALLERLRDGALATARSWPSWEESTGRMAAALAELRALRPPPATAGASSLLADIDAACEELRREALRLRREIERGKRELLLRQGDVAWREEQLVATRRQLEELQESLDEVKSSRAYRLALALRRAYEVTGVRALAAPFRATRRRPRR